MQPPKKFSLIRQLKSIQFAIEGIRSLIVHEHNARIHLTATIAVILFSFFLKISNMEWLAISIVIGLVWMAEMFNTCIEKTMDIISQERRREIKYVKDMAAGAVLVSSIISLVVGAIIFIPKFL